MSCKALGQGRGIQKRTGQNPCPITRRTNGEGKTYKEHQSQCQGLGWYRARGRRPDSEGGPGTGPGVQDSRTASGVREGSRRAHFSFGFQGRARDPSKRVLHGRWREKRLERGQGAGCAAPTERGARSPSCRAQGTGWQGLSGWKTRLVKENKFATAMDLEGWYQLGSCRNSISEK